MFRYGGPIKEGIMTGMQDRPGYKKGIGLYSIGTYTNWEGTWGTTVEGITSNSDIWANWMKNNAPETEYFLYLGEEDLNYSKLESWANGLVTHDGPGKTMPTLGAWYRSDPQTILAQVPSLSRPNFRCC